MAVCGVCLVRALNSEDIVFPRWQKSRTARLLRFPCDPGIDRTSCDPPIDVIVDADRESYIKQQQQQQRNCPTCRNERDADED